MAGAATGATASIGLLSTAVVLLGTVAVVSAVKSFAAFDDQLRLLGVTSSATASELQGLVDLTRELSAGTRFTGLEVVKGFTQLARAGRSVSEQMEALPSILSLAAAQMTNLDTTAQGVLGTLGQFGRSTAETAGTVNILQRAAVSSNITLIDMFQSLKLAGAGARQAGISLQEMVAAIGTLGDANIRGTLAGTALRGIIKSLVDPTAEAKKEFVKLGLSMEDLDVLTIGLNNALLNLNRSGAGTVSFMKIFTQRASSAAAALAVAVQNTAELESEMFFLGHAAEDAANTIEGGVGGALRRAGTASERAGVAFGSMFENNEAVDVYTKSVNFLAEVMERIAKPKPLPGSGKGAFVVLEEILVKSARASMTLDKELIKLTEGTIDGSRIRELIHRAEINLLTIRKGISRALHTSFLTPEEVAGGKQGIEVLEKALLKLIDTQKALKQARDDALRDQADALAAFNVKLEDHRLLVESIQAANQRAADTVQVFGFAAEDAFSAAISGAENFREAMAKIAEAVVRDLFRILVTQRLINAAASALSTSTPDAPTQNIRSSLPSGNFTPVTTGTGGLAHGGIINQRTRFGGHATGEGGRAEVVLPIGTDSSGDVGIRGGGGTSIVMNISTPNGDSFRRSKRMIADSIRRQFNV